MWRKANTRLRLIATLMFVVIDVRAQDAMSLLKMQSDSLSSLLGQYNKEDTTRLNILFQLTTSLTNPLEQEKTAYEAIQLAGKFSNPKLLGKAFKNLGNIFWKTGRYKRAIAYFDQYLQQGQKAEDKSMIIDGYSRIGRVHSVLANYVLALRYYFQSLEISQELGDKKNVAETSLLVGWIYLRMDEFENSEKYHIQTRKLADELGDKKLLALVYNADGARSRKQNKLELALDYHQKSIALNLENKNFSLLSKAYNNIARVYLDLKNYDIALQYLEKSMQIKKELGDLEGLSHSLRACGMVYDAKEEYNKSVAYLLQSMTIAEEIFAMDMVLSCSELLAESYAKMNDFENAWKYQRRFAGLRDSLFAETESIEIGRLETQRELSEHMKMNEFLQIQKDKEIFRRNALIIILTLLTFLLGFILYYLRKKERIERGLLEKERKMDQLKSRFFANVSHEMRTPLILIADPLKRLVAQDNLSPSVKSRLFSVIEYTNQMTALNDELMEIVKLESSANNLNIQPVLFTKFINKIAKAQIPAAQLKEINFHFICDLNEDCCIATDSVKLLKILNNLIGNAFKYTDYGGVVTLTVEENDKEQIKIQVKDTGRGIHKDELKKIFDRYYQSQHFDAPPEGGLGVGLALVKDLVEQLGCSIHVDSEPGKGSCFTLLLPKVTASMAEAQPLEQNQFESHLVKLKDAHKKESLLSDAARQVMIVEDHLDLRLYLEDILAGHYRLISKQNGQEAWQFLQDENNKIDLLISDVMMPRMDGFELMERIKKNERLCHIPLILLTARVGHEDRIKALLVGVDDYLTKPFDSMELLTRCKRLLENDEKRKAGRWVDDEGESTEQMSIEDLDFIKIIEDHLRGEVGNSSFVLEVLSRKVGVSHRTIHRKIKRMTGLNLNEYFREIRLAAARDLLVSGQCRTVAEVSAATGFENATYFSKKYTERFGKKPSHYLYEQID